LESALNILRDTFCTRNVTGNEAIETLVDLLNNMSEDNADILCKVINRDLRINCGKTLINKVWKDLIIDPPYMRCGIYNDMTAKKIIFPAAVQIKADGMYQAVTVEDMEVTFTSRSGEVREFPILKSIFEKLPNGVYIGELLIEGITSRSEANGLINSDEPPHKDIYIQLWDYVSLNEYRDAKHEDRNIPRMVYSDRFDALGNIVVGIPNDGEFKHVRYIETKIVDNIQLALKVTSEWMNKGYEGSILKDLNNVFKDHTSPTQLKLKLEIELEVRVTGFTDGTKGTKRESTFGAITFQNDEGTIIGQCSGFTDKQLMEFNSKRDELIGVVMSVMCNDLTKGRDNNYYALSHPRFVEFRNDKDTTDSLERALELKNSAMMLGDK
jgi:ATP-dependent DNA ligase